MGQDIRKMMRDYHPNNPKLSEGHEARFLEKLDATMEDRKSPGIYMWMRIAALFVVALGIGSYFYFNNNNLVSDGQLVNNEGDAETTIESRISLGDRYCAMKLSSLKLRIAKSSTSSQSPPAMSGNQ